MKQILKKSLAMIMSLLMIITIVPLSSYDVFAADANATVKGEIDALIGSFPYTSDVNSAKFLEEDTNSGDSPYVASLGAASNLLYSGDDYSSARKVVDAGDPVWVKITTHFPEKTVALYDGTPSHILIPVAFTWQRRTTGGTFPKKKNRSVAAAWVCNDNNVESDSDLFELVNYWHGYRKAVSWGASWRYGLDSNLNKVDSYDNLGIVDGKCDGFVNYKYSQRSDSGHYSNSDEGKGSSDSFTYSNLVTFKKAPSAGANTLSFGYYSGANSASDLHDHRNAGTIYVVDYSKIQGISASVKSTYTYVKGHESEYCADYLTSYYNAVKAIVSVNPTSYNYASDVAGQTSAANTAISNAYNSYGTLAANGPTKHNYVAAVTAPTCTAQGYTRHTCSHCSVYYDDTYVNALGHNPVAVARKEATCTEDGNIAYWKCSRCNKYYSDANATTEITQASTVINKKGHTLSATAAKAATCTTAGNIAYWHCSVCNKYFSDSTGSTSITQAQTVINATGHLWSNTKTFLKSAATCTTDAVYYQECSTCHVSSQNNGNTTWTDANSRTGHALAKTNAVAATCTTAGNSDYWYCSNCNKYFSDEAATNEIALTATVIGATGHALTATTANAATCTDNGNIAYWYCSNCSKYFSDAAATSEITQAQTVIGATGHTWTNTKKYAKSAATCTADAVYYKECSVCGVSSQNNGDATWTDTNSRTGHNFSGVCVQNGAGKHSMKCVNTGCTAIGYNGTENATVNCSSWTYVEKNGSQHTKTCADCAYSTDENHIWNGGEQTKAPSCTETGTMSYECTVCTGSKTETIPTVAHNTTKVDAVAPDCDDAGNIEYWTCAVCHKLFSDAAATTELSAEDVVILANGHNFAGAFVQNGAGKHSRKCTNTGCTAIGWGETENATVACSTWTYENKNGDVHTKSCANCGYAVDEGHGWNAGVQTKAPSCTEEGTKKYTCTLCPATYTEPISKISHTATRTAAKAATCTVNGNIEYWTCSVCNKIFSDAACTNEITAADTVVAASGHAYVDVVTAPTCTAQGYTTHTCSNCDDSYVDTYVPAKGHTEVTDAAVAATCTEPGKTEGSHCSVCNAIIIEQQTIPAKGHTEVIDAAVAATCTEPGKTEGSHCSVCNAVIVAQTTVPANGHTEVIDAAVAATCTETGLTEGKHCSVCNAVIVAQEEVAANGHTEVTDAAVAATCTATGLTEGKHCSVCNTVIVAQETVSKIPHSYVDVVTAPTCTDQGYTTHTCSVCGDSYVDAYVDANGHNFNGAYAQNNGAHNRKCANCDAYGLDGVAGKTEECSWNGGVETTLHSCTTDGVMTYTCTVCNGTKTEVVPAAHEWSDVHVTKEATCTQTGKQAATCDVCGISQNEITIPAVGHQFGEWVTVSDSTCSAEGSKMRTCTVCNGTDANEPGGIEYGVIAKKAHTEVTDAAVSATCTETGLTEGKHCSVCDAVIVAQTTIPANGHTEVTDAAVSATCTEAGKTEGKHCSVCNAVIVAQTTIPANGHTEVTDAAVSATCTEAGKTEGSHCSVCNAVIVAQTTVPAKGHTEVTDAAVAATCTEAGKTEGSHCSVCNAVIVAQTTVPANGHTEVTDAAVSATCTEPGKTAGIHCSVCDTVIVAQATVPAKGHTAVTDAAVSATCTEAGKTEGSHCSVCNAVIVAQTTVPANGHTTVTDAAVAATCTVAGKTEGSHCSVCNAVLVAQTTVPAKGHTFGDVWTVDTAATCSTFGSEHRTCTVCNGAEADGNETETRQIAKTAHTPVVDPRVEPTCKKTGLTEGSHCGVCFTTIVAQETLAKVSHNIVTIPAKAATCTEAGLTEGTKCSYCNEVFTAQEVIPAKGHTVVDDAAVAPGCTTTGKTAGSHCSVCGTVIVAQTTIEALDHNYSSSIVSAASCNKTGTRKYTCSRCNDSYTETIPALEHSWDDGVQTKAPTCTAQGEITYTCANCGAKKKEAVGNASHSFVTSVVDPTCTAAGYTKYTCSACGLSYSGNNVPALGHTTNSIVIAPTCNDYGYTRNECTRCGVVTKDNYVAPIAHNYIEKTIAPTCTAQGYVEYTCEYCKSSYKSSYVPATGHDYEASIMPATCTESGYTLYVCRSCNNTYKDEFVQATGHDYKISEKVEPTNTKSGYILYRCDKCGHSYKETLFSGNRALVCATLYGVDGKPLSEGTITFTNQASGESFTLKLDKNGYFTQVIEAGEYDVVVHKDGYLNSYGTIIIDNGEIVIDIPACEINPCDCYCHQNHFWARIYRLIIKILRLLGINIQCCECSEI